MRRLVNEIWRPPKLFSSSFLPDARQRVDWFRISTLRTKSINPVEQQWTVAIIIRALIFWFIE